MISGNWILPPNGIHYGVCKEGILQFIVKRNINITGDMIGL